MSPEAPAAGGWDEASPGSLCSRSRVKRPRGPGVGVGGLGPQQLSPFLQGLLSRCREAGSPRRQAPALGIPRALERDLQSAMHRTGSVTGPLWASALSSVRWAGRSTSQSRGWGLSHMARRADLWRPVHSRRCVLFCFLPPPPPSNAEPKLPVQRPVPGARQKGLGREGQVRPERRGDGERVLELMEVFLSTSP